MSRTPLTAKTAVTLACNLGKVVPRLGLSEEDGAYWNGHLDELHERVQGVLSRGSWLDQLIAADEAAWQRFTGQKFDFSPCREIIEKFGVDRARDLDRFGPEVHCWPKVSFAQDSKYRGQRIKLEPWFWQQLAAGKILRCNSQGEFEVVKEVVYELCVLVVDTRLKPSYNGGKQMFADDEGFMGEMVESLRCKGRIEPYSPSRSRFNISSREWDDAVRPALSARAEFTGITWGLEDPIRMNVIPQLWRHMPRKNDGKTDVWVWLGWFFAGASHRLCGGGSARGGLADVSYYDVGNHWSYRTVRPLGVLDA